MLEEKDLKQAQIVYKSLCERLDEHKWHYKKNEEELSIKCGVQGDDLPMELNISVDAERKLVTLLSAMPFSIPENRRGALAVAVSQANDRLIDGNFDYNYQTGILLFRWTASYRDSIIGKELFTYMLSCACYSIDEYNDKFLMVAKNDMTPEEIVKFIK